MAVLMQFLLCMIFTVWGSAAGSKDGAATHEVIEVTKPIDIPANAKECRKALFDVSFAEANPFSSLEVDYVPPKECGVSWPVVVLEWRASCKGLQRYDRIAGVWLGGVQILHTSTAKSSQEAEWVVERDITTYKRLLQSPQKLLVALPSFVSAEMGVTGICNVSISAVFYYLSDSEALHTSSQSLRVSARSRPEYAIQDLFEPPIVLPVSSSTPGNGTGLWFVIENATDTKSASVILPRNTRSGYLEVFVSFHGEDEFWFDDDEEPFREVVVSLDGKVVDAIWPFVVIYGGGINPRYWQAVAPIGAFNPPSYFVELEPFVAVLADGNEHTFSFTVTSAKHVWYVGANLVLSTDSRVLETKGGLLHLQAPPTEVVRHGNSTVASRSISSSGYINLSTGGNVTTFFERKLYFSNSRSASSNLEQLTRTTMIYFAQAVEAGVSDYWVEEMSFPLSVGSRVLAHSFNKNFSSVLDLGSGGDIRGGNFTSLFKNYQVAKEDETTQSLSYEDTDDSCYSRSLSVTNYVYSYDNISTICS